MTDLQMLGNSFWRIWPGTDVPRNIRYENTNPKITFVNNVIMRLSVSCVKIQKFQICLPYGSNKVYWACEQESGEHLFTLK